MNVDLLKGYRPSDDEPYMYPKQIEYFRQKLFFWREILLQESLKISDLLKEKSNRELEADEAQRIRTRNHYITLIHKINDALKRIRDGTYGYCEQTGKEIGIKCLEADPTATLSYKAQRSNAQSERRYRK